MNWLEFTHGIISAVAWPIAAVVIALKVRNELGLLLSKVKRIRYKDSEIEIEQEIAGVTKEADESGLPQLQPMTNNDRVFRLAHDSPRGAILDSWLAVEETLKEYCNARGIEGNINNPYQLIQAIKIHNADYLEIGSGLFRMLERLRALRNEAVHVLDSEISPEAAIEYSELSKRVIARIEEA